MAKEEVSSNSKSNSLRSSDGLESELEGDMKGGERGGWAAGGLEETWGKGSTSFSPSFSRRSQHVGAERGGTRKRRR